VFFPCLACFEDVCVECSNCLITTITSEPDPSGKRGVKRVPERERTAHDLSRSNHRAYRDHRHVEPAASVSAPQGWEVVMKRSSARRARRWVIQELTRRMDQLSDTSVRAILSGSGEPNGGGEKSSLIRSS
jgi:hypothetical protein